VKRLSALTVALATATLPAFSFSLVAPAAHAGAPVMCQGKVATIVGTAGDDTLTGTTAPDVIAGLGGDDTIESGGGLDLICGGQGADMISADAASTNYVYLDGGRGDDHLVSAVHFSHFDGGPGDDVEVNGGKAPTYLAETGTNSFSSTGAPEVHADFRLAGSGVSVDLQAGTAIFAGSTTTFALAPGTLWQVKGSRYDDVLKGSDAADVIGGRDGSDLIKGRGGDDRLAGNSGRDTLRGGAGADQLRFDFGDHVYGGKGGDYLNGRIVADGHALLRGGKGSNFLGIGVGPNGAGGRRYRHGLVDLARGVIDVDRHVTRFSGAFNGVLVLPLHVASWTLKGTNGPNNLNAPSPVVERGRGGDDVLITGGGNDLLNGGPGTDVGDAGPGKDVCISIEKPRFPPRRHTGCEIVR
jgi:Ca2+-binding RTX toxin-like protein